MLPFYLSPSSPPESPSSSGTSSPASSRMEDVQPSNESTRSAEFDSSSRTVPESPVTHYVDTETGGGEFPVSPDICFTHEPVEGAVPPRQTGEAASGPSREANEPRPHRHHRAHHRDEAPLRSYSLMDIENDAFTGVHEDDVENAMSHCLRNLQSVFSILLLCLGASLLLYWHEMRRTSPLLFYYILFSMLAELALAVCLACFMCLMTCLVGEGGAAYGSVMCGLLHRVAEGATHYTLTGVGAYTLYNFHDLEDSLFESEERIQEKFNWLLVYVGCEVIISLLYSLQTLGTLFGIFKFILIKIYAKLTGRGEVQFQQGDGPIIYASLEQYRRALPQMRNPVSTAFLRHHRLPVDSDGQQKGHEENGDLEMGRISTDITSDTNRSTQPLLAGHRDD
ncbi:transmembrane protein [Cystoisospora suis]|uniref:Transmembrane protein n=1 Tax=Cystoisospora suis TaxID=483139 RepID=A0A2C6L1M9_9APIC|nr:transmembrane protein [Cystoisospora suis]